MSALDPSARRSATVVALKASVIATISEEALSSIAADYPQVWRNMALELGERLRERAKFIRLPNERPQVFVGSSREMLPVANGIRDSLASDEVLVQVWTDGVFRATYDSLSSLLAVAERTDFAILAVGPDDTLILRGEELQSPRDNVVFELGLFLGVLGRDRTYIVRERGVDIHLPTDLLGITQLSFEAGTQDTFNNRLAKLSQGELQKLIKELGVR